MVGWRRQKDKEGLNMGKQVNLRQALRQARPATVSIRLPLEKGKPEQLLVSVNAKRYSIRCV